MPIRAALVVPGAVAALLLAPASWAQVAVPYYSPGAFAAALQVRGQAPYAAQFAEGARLLVEAMTALCEAGAAEAGRKRPASRAAEAARGDDDGAESAGGPDPTHEALLGAQQAWLATADSWERLEAVSVGPTLERRSARRIDFRPARPRSIRAAINAHGKGRTPPSARALERVGAPAKGLPALEWLLWDPAVPTHAAGCRYAIGLAQDVQREADALAEAHAEAATRWLAVGADPDSEEAAERIEAS